MTSAPALSAWTTASTKVPTHFSGQRMASPPKLRAATFRFAAALLRRRRLGKGTALGSVPVAAAQRRSAAVRAGLGQWPAPLEPKVFCRSRLTWHTPRFFSELSRPTLFSGPLCLASSRIYVFGAAVHPPGGPLVVSQEAARGIGIGACAVAFAVHCHCHTHTSLYVMLQCLGAEQPHAAGEAFCAFASPRDDDDDVRVVALNG